MLAVIYLIFNEGYVACSGADWTRPALWDEALRLARVLAALLPDEGEAQGLAALPEIQSSRLSARVGAARKPSWRRRGTRPSSRSRPPKGVTSGLGPAGPRLG